MAKILYVVPSEKLKRDLSRSILEHRRYYNLIYPKREYIDVDVTIRTSADLVDYEECNADVIVARGLLATILKKMHPSIPVVEAPVTMTDIMGAVMDLQKTGAEKVPIALIGLGMVFHQVKAVEELLDVELVTIDYLHQPRSPDIIKELLDEAVSRGFRAFAGGATLVRHAVERGYLAAFVDSGDESKWLALNEAQHIAATRRRERERSVRYETILNHSLEGIITTDTEKRIIQINSAAGRILGVDPADAGGIRIEKLIPEPKFMFLLGKDRDYVNEIFKLGRKRIVLNKVSASLGKENIGSVITFQDASNVQSAEIKIRSELHRRGLVAKYSFADIIGASLVLERAIETARTFARVPSNVLLVGETGTGKELFAQSMHIESPRKDAPFVAVNCAAIPENLMESEFFGYKGGAFTGASKEGRMGFFELAHGGTIFLDEVSEIPLKLQSKLLRVIQEGEIMRIGHDKIIPVNVRIICASNRDLKPLVREGLFREDLFYRLAVLQLRLPPLRERGEDIILLARHFVGQYSSIFANRSVGLSPQAKRRLMEYPWDGNIRELRNICEQLVVLNKSGSIGPKEVATLLALEMTGPVSLPQVKTRGASGPAKGILQEVERDLIISSLEKNDFNKTRTARTLGMNRSTLWRKMKEYGISCDMVIER
ncbi:sigma 54-interacting transcriptional regulator [Marispirochaeta sp.]|uniref:sigma 54-interacting transcriptional regulator n=1 Tax=Marispirochaeta sp. TaxID=2038653 RepID=UPI0029C8B371|nr:sigma 54-interacting transcriptional regulator [Marispirochaeta sp.]